MSYYYSKAVKFIENATSTEGFYDGIRDILRQAMEAETPLKNTYPEDYQIKRLQRMADAKYSQLENALQEAEESFEEICPICDHVNEYRLSDTKDYKNGKKIVVCQNCGSLIFACNLCDCDGCGKCYIEEGYKF